MFCQAATLNNIERSEVKEVNHCSSMNGTMAFYTLKKQEQLSFFLVRSSVVSCGFSKFSIKKYSPS